MDLNEKIEFKKIRDFGGILNATFEFIRQNFKKLFLSLLLIVGPAILLMGIVSGYNQARLLEFRFSRAIIGMIGLNYLVMVIVFQLLLCVTYSFIDLYLDREVNEFDISDVWSRVKNYFGQFLFSSIGAGLIVIIATVLLIIPGIYMSVVLSMIYMVMMREKLSFFDAISRCRYLITGNWWNTFGLLIVLYMIESFLSFVLTIPQMVVTIIRALHVVNGQNNISGISNIITIITSTIAALRFLFYSIVLIGIAFQYYSLLERKEAAGLFEKLESINTQN